MYYQPQDLHDQTKGFQFSNEQPYNEINSVNTSFYSGKFLDLNLKKLSEHLSIHDPVWRLAIM